MSNSRANDYVFSHQFKPGKHPMSQKKLQEVFGSILKKLGIVGRYSFYSWKHTGAVKAVQAGCHIKEIQVQLRHHSLDMVNEYLKDLGVFELHSIKNKFPHI